MRRNLMAIALALPLLASFAAPMAHAQSANAAAVSFGGMQGDPDLPIEVTSQELTVDQAKGTAVFLGNVLVVQGELRLSADEVRVQYDEAAGEIRVLSAKGNVQLVNASDSAQADSAEYRIISGEVTMQGNVSLTQGTATFTAQRFVADIRTGLGRLEGGVTSTFLPNAAQTSVEKQ